MAGRGPSRSVPAGHELVVELCRAVIARAGRELPADRALREELRKRSGVTPELGRAASQALFSYYRWRGWLRDSDSTAVQLQVAGDLARRFRSDPDSIQELSRRSFPQWIRGQMEANDEWVRSLQSEPRLWLRARSGKREAVARQLGDCRIEGEAGCLEYLGDADLYKSAPFREGAFEIQDINSQRVGELCGPRPGETWWDACAGEGGKTVHLSDLMENKGLIWASDRSEWRLRVLKRRAGRAGVFNYRSVIWQGGEKPPTKTRFDGVLLDAPCSGVGTWQRNPHARWTTSPQDVRELAAVQSRLLSRVAPALKPGGRLIYAVCTLTRPETVGVAESFESAHPEFECISLKHPLTGEASGQVWLWPQETGGNGMFIAAWRRRDSEASR